MYREKSDDTQFFFYRFPPSVYVRTQTLSRPRVLAQFITLSYPPNAKIKKNHMEKNIIPNEKKKENLATDQVVARG